MKKCAFCGKEIDSGRIVCSTCMDEYKANREPRFGEWMYPDDKMPPERVPVIGYIKDAEETPAVRECYHRDGGWFFPALGEFREVSRWMPMPKE